MFFLQNILNLLYICKVSSKKKKKSKVPVLTKAEIDKRKKLSRASKKYHKVRRAVVKHLDSLDIDFSVEERRSLIHLTYVNFKEKSIGDIRLKEIYKFVDHLAGAEEGRGKGPKPGLIYYNPLKIPLPELTGINWWELDEFLSTTLVALCTPNNLRYEVNGGAEFGSTSIMSLLLPNGSVRYNYMISGVEQIIENIRSSFENKSGPEWVGEPMVRPGKTDDGDPDSYFVQFYLVDEMGNPFPTSVSYESAEFDIAEPSPDEKRKRRKEVDQKEEDLEKIRKDLAKQKEQRKRKRPDQKEKIEPEPPAPVPGKAKAKKPSKTKPEKPQKPEPKESAAEKRAKNVERILDIQKNELKDLENLFRDGLLTKKEFLDERRAVMAQTSKALDKFEKGGKL